MSGMIYKRIVNKKESTFSNSTTYISCLYVCVWCCFIEWQQIHTQIHTHPERDAYKQANEEKKNIHNDLRLINNLVASFCWRYILIRFPYINVCSYTVDIDHFLNISLINVNPVEIHTNICLFILYFRNKCT